MQGKNSIYGLLLLLLMGSVCRTPDLLAQSNFYKFPVAQEGVYKVTASQALQLGVSSVEELTIYGYPGMLPQKLDSSFLGLKEIPVKNIGGDLYFYLSAAHSIEAAGKMANYQTHYFTDTLNYLIRTDHPHTAAVSTLKLQASYGPAGVLYQMKSYKKELFNLLSSGRNWYGDRVFDGESISIDFKGMVSQDLPIYYHGIFMAQSRSESSFRFSLNQETIETITIPSITNSTYGLKGHNASISGFTSGGSEAEALQINLQFQTPDRNGTGYLDYFLIGIPFLSSALPTGIFYNLTGKASNLTPLNAPYIWDITDFFKIKDITAIEPMVSDAHKIAIFTRESTQPIAEWERVDLNLRSQPSFAELVIIAHDRLMPEAERLARYKNSIGINAQVVTVQEIYDAFGYGNPDITAIRNFLAFHYHQGSQLQNVLLFGKGTFDYKNKLNGRPNLVPIYSSRNSLNPLTTYSSDDYFGFLNFGEGMWEETKAGDLNLSIGVGRIPVVNIQEARIVVDKIIHYGAPEITLGDWKRRILFIADNGDNQVHLKDSEYLAAYLSKNHPEFILEKLYLDSFEQIPAGSGDKSPRAKETLEVKLDSSFLFVNFIGHGNETTLTAEEIFTVADLKNWPENHKLPVFVTATCEFGRHDSPLIRSGAEELLIAEKKGAIALLSTGRPVFSSINFALNRAFIEAVFEKEDGEHLTLGEIFMRTKNNSLNGPLNRNFSLLGDPSLKLALPEFDVRSEGYYDMVLQTEVDTLNAMQHIRYKGNITHPLTQAIQGSFNGTFEITLSDKPVARSTLGGENSPATFMDGQIYIHRGKGKVRNGHFEGEIFIPKDIDHEYGEGTIRFFAQDKMTFEEGFGASHMVIGGASVPKGNDSQGPQIKLFIQDSSQSVHTVSATTVDFLAALEDQHGININPHLGQNISLRINNGEKIDLSPYYSSIDGSFTKGYLEAPLSGLEEGSNTLTLQVWDNLGNPSSKTIEIRVIRSKKIKIISHLTYPNPASTTSHFTIKHNRQGENLTLQVQIFSLSGSKIFDMNKRFPKADSLLEDISWIFMQSKTKYPAKGTYLYTLELKSEEDGSSDIKSGKIIIP